MMMSSVYMLTSVLDKSLISMIGLGRKNRSFPKRELLRYTSINPLKFRDLPLILQHCFFFEKYERSHQNSLSFFPYKQFFLRIISRCAVSKTFST